MENPGINSSLSKVFYFVFESIVLITEWLKAEEEPSKNIEQLPNKRNAYHVELYR